MVKLYLMIQIKPNLILTAMELGIIAVAMITVLTAFLSLLQSVGKLSGLNKQPDIKILQDALTDLMRKD